MQAATMVQSRTNLPMCSFVSSAPEVPTSDRQDARVITPNAGNRMQDWDVRCLFSPFPPG